MKEPKKTQKQSNKWINTLTPLTSLLLSCRWLSLLWNHAIAPSVSDAVIRGSGSDTASQGQQKVANTALYVLMQRAIVSGCPLTGQEKERYLSSFHGSNELDIQMRGKIRPASSASSAADSSDESEANNLTPMKRPSTEALRRLADQPTITMPALVQFLHLHWDLVIQSVL